MIDELKSSPTVVRYRIRFVIVTNFSELLAIDTKTGENLMIPIRDIDQYFTFFLPWAGMEKAQYVSEAHADVKAAERMGKLFDELLAANPALLAEHPEVVTCSTSSSPGCCSASSPRTPAFSPRDSSRTRSVPAPRPIEYDVNEFLAALFTALDTEDPADKPTHLAAFPYVNGRLFVMAPQSDGAGL